MTASRLPPAPECLAEAALLGLFMIAAAAATVVMEHPRSPVRRAIDRPWRRRAFIGLAMGATAIALIESPWGGRSGAHMNPAVTLTFLGLGRMTPATALGYIAAQFAGGLAGMGIARLLFGRALAHPAVCYAVTVPGPAGARVAFIAETLMASGMMLMVLVTTNLPHLAPFTPWFAGGLLFLYITFAAPLSGMSLNPARTVASAVPSRIWRSVWVYLTAPLLGMALAALVHRWVQAPVAPACPKLHHGRVPRCIFCGQSAPVPFPEPGDRRR